jgi:hypothetical protein
MTVWYAARTMSWPTRVVIAAGLFAMLLVATVPVALFAGLILTLLGHVVVGLALFGASILAAGAAVMIAALSGVRHVRKLIRRQGPRVVQLRRGDYHIE